MEGRVEAVDDQGSGWCEVRKKHRSSSKHSMPSLGGIGGLSGKNTSGNRQLSLSKKHRIIQGNDRPWRPDNEVKASMLGRNDITNATTNSIKNGIGSCLPQNSGVQQRSEENACPGSSHLAIATSIVRDTAGSACNSHSPMSVPKIKWGYLDDGDLLQHCESDSQLDLRSDEAQDRSSKDRFYEDHDLVLQESSTNLQEKKPAETFLDVQTCPNDKALYNVEELRHEIHEVDEISRKKVQVPTTSESVIALDSLSLNNRYKEYREAMNNDPDRSVDGEQGTSLKRQFPMSAVNVSNGSDVNCGNEKSEILQTVVLVKLSKIDSSEQARTGSNPQSPLVAVVDESVTNELPVSCVNQGKTAISMHGELLPVGPNNVENSGEAVSEVKDSEIDNDEEGSSSKVVTAHDIDFLASENCGILIEATGTDSVEEHGCSGDEMRQDKHSSVQSSIVPEEGTTDESKERFRERLWCFLFENLNRAVDELYLLCELECDMEQMKEAMLVLEEAASDFQELTKRVLGFEHVKKFTSKSMDGSPVTLKSDHRRPHALSWEVRRMMTSPHKAEILSSSLEAFKKIQQERAKKVAADNSNLEFQLSNHSCGDSSGTQMRSAAKYDGTARGGDSTSKTRKQSESFDCRVDPNCEKRELVKSKNRVNFVQDVHGHQNNSSYGLNSSRPFRDTSAGYGVGKSKREHEDKPLNRREQYPAGSTTDRKLKSADHLRKLTPFVEKDTEKKMPASWKSMNAWKEKRNWEDILSSPYRVSSRISHSPGMSRRSGERARVLHDKFMSPEKKKKNALDLKKEAEEKHARAMRIRSELEIERVQKLQRTSEKLNRVSEWQAVRTMKLREGMYARHQRSENRHVAFIAQVVKRAGDESSKVSEVRFITSLNEENKKHMLRQKLQDSELRRAEKLQILKTKQKEDMAREEAVLERRKILEAEKLQRHAETQRKKEEAQARREEERKASSAAREARAIEQVRRREERAKAQQEEAELLAQKLSERLGESEQRRKFYLEQIRERASMDFRDQSSPLLHRSGNKEGQGRSTPTKNGEDHQENGVAEMGASTLSTGSVTLQYSLKRRIKKIRQRLMALKYEFLEPPGGSEGAGIGVGKQLELLE